MELKNYNPDDEDLFSDGDIEDRDEEVNDLAFDENKGSYEFDVEDDDPDWEHPSDYDTVSNGANEDSSVYDASNPYVGSEYADLEDLQEDDINNLGMRIVDKKNLKVSKFDEVISRDEEDQRDDLDEEGYPKFEN